MTYKFKNQLTLKDSSVTIESNHLEEVNKLIKYFTKESKLEYEIKALKQLLEDLKEIKVDNKQIQLQTGISQNELSRMSNLDSLTKRVKTMRSKILKEYTEE